MNDNCLTKKNRCPINALRKVDPVANIDCGCTYSKVFCLNSDDLFVKQVVFVVSKNFLLNKVRLKPTWSSILL